MNTRTLELKLKYRLYILFFADARLGYAIMQLTTHNMSRQVSTQ